MNALLIASAWTELLYFDLVGFRGFRAIQRTVQRTKTRSRAATTEQVTQVVNAMRVACVLYAKPALCLQRSVVVTRLLRRRGIPADLVIGCRIPPLKAHAWVEVSGEVVSDHQDDLEFYRVLDRW
jgi:hypothetical protein